MSGSKQIHHLPKPPRAWLTLLIGGVLVLSGMVIGAGGTVLLVKNRLEQPDQAPSHFSRRLAERMTRDLDLTREQKTDIQEIFARHQKELHAVRKSVEQRVTESFNTMQSEVEAILTPQQAKMWRERARRFNSRGERSRPARRNGVPMHNDRPPWNELDSRIQREPGIDGESRWPRSRLNESGDRPHDNDNATDRYNNDRHRDDAPASPPPPPPR